PASAPLPPPTSPLAPPLPTRTSRPPSPDAPPSPACEIQPVERSPCLSCGLQGYAAVGPWEQARGPRSPSNDRGIDARWPTQQIRLIGGTGEGAKLLVATDVLIAGAGPAGSCVAAALSAVGLRTLLVDAGVDRTKQLAGEFIHPPGALDLAALGFKPAL